MGYAASKGHPGLIQGRTMQDWQRRVIDEKKELDARIGRLEAMLDAPKSRDAVSLRQFDLMRRQLGYMQAYSSTLAQRISEFQAVDAA